jgi:hypothetical protein
LKKASAYWYKDIRFAGILYFRSMHVRKDGNSYWLNDFVSGYSDGLRLMLLLVAALLFHGTPPAYSSYWLLLFLFLAALVTAGGNWFTLKQETAASTEQRLEREKNIYHSLELEHAAAPSWQENTDPALTPQAPAPASALRVFLFYLAGGLPVISLLWLEVDRSSLLSFSLPAALLLCFSLGWLRGYVYGTHRLGEAFRFTLYMAFGLLLMYLLARFVTA